MAKKNFNRPIFFFALFIFTMLFANCLCADDLAEMQPQATQVKTYRAKFGAVWSTSEYIGKAEAIQTVNVCPEVSARIAKVHFKDGAFVKAGETLFTLNNSQYQATVNLRKAELSKAEANLSQAQKYLSRLKAADRRSVPASDMDTAESNVKQAQAEIAQAKANLQIAQIDLNNVRVKAPISGKIGRAQFTQGNYVTTGTVLAVINQIDPIRISFNLPDREYMNNKNLEGKAQIILADGNLYDGLGKKDFDDNTMNSSTGTLTTWLRFDNKNGVIFPGSLVRVVLSSPEEQMILIPQAAILSGSDSDYVYVAENNKAVRRKIVSGVEKGNYRAVKSGLRENDYVIVEGIQSISDGTAVQIIGQVEI